MADPMLNNTSLTKKKGKKKKRKTVGNGESDSPVPPQEQSEKYPKQASDQHEPVITTTKCTCCGKPVRQLVRGVRNPDSNTRIPFICDGCLKLGITPDDFKSVVDSYVAPRTPMKENLCNCAACVSKRENAVPPEVERDAHITQSYWMEIRHIVRCIYRDSMNLSELSTRESIGSDKMRDIVKKLCSRDPHQFFQRLETLAREYLLEVKVRLLEQLSCGFNSPQLAIEFIQMLLDEYSTLCAALPGLLFLLEPLEATDYVRRLGVTIELVNKNIFRELIFAESFMSSNLPLIIAQLRLASLSSDPFHRSTADALSQSYISLDQEMEEIGKVWKSAKEQLQVQHQELRKHEDRQREQRQATLAKIKAEGEALRKSQRQSDTEDYTTEALQATTPSNVPPKAKEKPVQPTGQTKSPSSLPTDTSSNHKSSSSNTLHLTSLIPSQPHDHTSSEQEKDIGSWLTKEQVAEFSKILFKCIKPIGEPEFRITDNIATHTITLKIDMTAIDLRHAEALCTREQVEKYENLGMRREEIAEVALKLNAIKHLGINLRIDDLFDEHGFMVVDGSEVHEEREDAVYFVEDGRNSIKGKEKLIQEELARSELIDLKHEKEKVIQRENSDTGEGRETDLLQSMTMKIRFMKSVINDEVRNRLVSDSEQVMFESCDQVQMKLTQLELNTVRLMCASTALAANLGMINKPKEATSEKFLNTEAHQPFVDLLLEQGKVAEQAKKSVKEEEKSKEVAITKTSREETKDEKPKEGEEYAVVHPVTGEATPFRSPMSIPIQTQNCQCFACIGAVAAQQTEGSSRPLNPVDPSGSQLSIQDTLIAGLEEGAHKVTHQGEKDTLSTKVTNKTEHVWQNWMSTNDITSLEEEAKVITTTSVQATTPNPAHTSSGPSTASNTTSMTTSSSNSTENHTHTTHHSQPETTPNSSSSTACITATSSNADKGQSNNGTTSNGGGPVRRYCPCCYCELFGHNSPATAPTSHNYTKQRDKMRQKLEKKRNRKDGEELHHHHQCPHGHHYSHIAHHHHSHTHDHHQTGHQPRPQTPPVVPSIQPVEEPEPQATPPAPADERSLDDLLRFIEGKDFTPSESPVATTTTKTKKKNKKKKNNELPSPVETTDSTPLISNSIANGSIHKPQLDPITKETTSSGKKGMKREEKNANSKPVSNPPKHHSMQNGSLKKVPSSPSPPVPYKVTEKHVVTQSPKPTRKSSRRGHHNGIAKVSDERSGLEHTSSDIEDDYDQELEDFKKLCFSSAPVDARKKLHVSLNMQDIISKIK